MIEIKSIEEVEKIRNSGKILRSVLNLVRENIKPGVATIELSRLAEDFIIKHGAIPAFKGYKGFPEALCISINEELIHGIPGSRTIKESDVVSIDGGVLFEGWYSDAAFTVIAGESVDENARRLVEVTEQALYVGIKEAKINNRIGDIGHSIQNFVESFGFSVIRDYSGHGIGKKLHEDPSVPNFGRPGQGVLLKKGMVIAIEPMVAEGNNKLFVEGNGWTVKTLDHSLAAHFEHTVAIGNNGPEVLTA